MNLRARFALAITIVVTAVLATTCGFFYFSQKREALRQIRSSQEEASRSLVKVCEESLLTQEDMQRLFSAIREPTQKL